MNDPEDVETIASSVFANSVISVEEGAAQLRQSIDYYQTFNASQESISPPGNI